MNINYSKIISDKRARNYSSMATENLTDFQKHLDLLLTESDTKIKSVLPTLCESDLSVPFVKYYVRTEAMDDSDIAELLKSVPSDDERIRPMLEDALEYKGSMDWLRDDAKYEFACKRYHATCVYESYYADELGMIGYNINTSPEALMRYVDLIRDIELDNYNSICKEFPALLKKNTELILGLKVRLTGQSANIVVSLPVVIVKRLCNEGTKQQKKEFIKIIDNNINMMKAYINTADSRYYNIYTAYLDNLYASKQVLVESMVVGIRESFATVEHIADMQPDILMYEDAIVSDPVAELEDAMADIIFNDDDITMEQMCKIVTLEQQINHMYVVEENKVVRKAALKVEKGSTKVASKIKAKADDARRTGTIVKKSVDPFVNAVTKVLNDLKEKDRKGRRAAIVEGNYRSKLFGFLRKGILSIAVGMAAPGPAFVGVILGVITMIAAVGIDITIDARERKKILAQLETELAVVNEKLEDSRGDEKKENKYQLIRIKKKLEADIDRVKFRLK